MWFTRRNVQKLPGCVEIRQIKVFNLKPGDIKSDSCLTIFDAFSKKKLYILNCIAIFLSDSEKKINKLSCQNYSFLKNIFCNAYETWY